MRSFLVALLLLVLPACETTDSMFSSSTFTDAGADKIIPADTPAERSLRACLATAVLSELITYRVLWFESTAEERLGAATTMRQMFNAISQVRYTSEGPDAEDPFWFQTQMFYVVAGMVRSVEGVITDSAMETIADALTGQVRDLLTTLRVRAGQVALANYMIEDIRRYFELDSRGEPEWFDTGWNMCEQRVNTNIGLLG